MSPLNWRPHKDGHGFLEQTYNSLGTEDFIALIRLHAGVLTLHGTRMNLAERNPPLITSDGEALTERGRELIDWMISTGRWKP